MARTLFAPLAQLRFFLARKVLTDTINAAYDLGANSYLVKPGNPADIARMVETIQRYWVKLNEAPQLVMRAEQR